MTTLFNVFCPVMCSFKLTSSQSLFLFFTSMFCLLFLFTFSFEALIPMGELLFPMEFSSFVFLFVFVLLLMFNLISLTLSSYTVTTTLSFNLFLGFTYWTASILLFTSFKPHSFSSLLPLGSPLLLSPFLCMIELVSISARPVTLCFRLLANMCAGHVILGLIFKANWGMWLLGLPLMTLEILVAFIQAFVFSMLISVYFQEAVSH
uniref:ATP synthase subunit a n=1 Tax=Xiphinema rivesi TaxID=70223 RepID=A0A1P8C780_9BILA|nr:ATP synthase F0 subunit 6 [Xiphinema rivesi]AOT84259.1 ATP synthase F0 subunit 6 [Xiphinema rivesi]